jgi:hypothetical protein
MAWLDTIKEKAGSLIGGAQGFPKTLNTGDFMTADVAVVASKWQVIGSYTVPAQQAYAFGFGDKSTPYNQGYLYALLAISSAGTTALSGKIRLVVKTANDVPKGAPVYEEDLTALHGSTSDRALKQSLPFSGLWANDNDKLVIEYYPASAVTLALTACVLLIPCTNKFGRFV